jgi:shikimate kinase / 3-dehydroquinate synthase
VTVLLGRLGLPTDLSSQPLKEALPLVALDKKRKAGALRVVLLRALGAPLLHTSSLAELTSLLVPAPGVAT